MSTQPLIVGNQLDPTVRIPSGGSSGQILATTGSSYYWTTNVSGSATLAGLTDVNIPSPANGDVLSYDTSSGKWIASVVSGTGTVTNVAVTVPSFLSVSGSPITTTGTIAISLATQSAGIVFAGPSTGSAAIPTFRALVSTDIPSLAYISSINSSNVIGGTGISTSGTITSSSGTLTISNTGVTGLIAGSGISISASVGNITISSTGGGGSVTSVAISSTDSSITVSGSPITSSGTINIVLPATGVSATTYGDATHVGTFTVAANGLITSATATSITFPVITFNTRTGAITLTSGDVTTALGYTPGIGSVSSIGLADNSTTPIYTVTGSPVTSSGTFSITLTTQTANKIFAGPSSGSAAQPTFRTLVAADIPSLTYISTISSSNVVGGTGISTSGTITSSGGTLTITNAGVTGLVAGSGISISGATGNITISATGGGGGGGSVTSIALSDGSTTPIYSISGSPITTSGTLTFTLATQSVGVIFAGPSSGSPAQPTFRALIAADIPALAYLSTIGTSNVTGGAGISISGTITSSGGTLTITNAGVTSIAGTSNQITASASTGAVTLSLPSAITITTSITISGLTANSFLYSGTAGLLTTTSAPTNGQLLIGNTGNAPVAAALTAGTAISVTNGAGSITIANTGVTSLAGTANQITASGSTGSITLSLPSAVTITTSLTISGLTASSFLYSGTAGLLTTTTAPTNGQLLIGSTGAAPVAAALTAGTAISVTNGAGSITIANTGVTSITAGSGISVSGSTGSITISSTGGGGSGTVTNVALSDASTTPIYSVSGTPVTTTGTLTFTLTTQTANKIFAGPSSGSAAQPTFRTLVAADLTGLVVSSLAGTTNQITASGSTGSVTLSIPSTFIAPGSVQVTTALQVSTTTGITAAGSSQGTATVLTTDYNEVTTVTLGQGVLLPTGVPGRTVTIRNQGAALLAIYPGSGARIDVNGTNAPGFLEPATTFTLTAVSSTQWYSDGIFPDFLSILGTTNQIVATVDSSTYFTTLSLPSTVTITGLILSGLTPNSFLYSGTSGTLTTTSAPTNGQLLIGSTGSAPVTAALTAGTNITITNGAGSITIGNTTDTTNASNISSGTLNAARLPAIRYDISTFYPGVPGNSQTLLRWIAPRAVTIPSGGTNSQCSCGASATGSTTITIKQNGTSVGTITVSASGTTGSFTVSSTINIAQGDIITITGPGTADATLGDIAITLAGTA